MLTCILHDNEVNLLFGHMERAVLPFKWESTLVENVSRFISVLGIDKSASDLLLLTNCSVLFTTEHVRTFLSHSFL